MAAMSGIRARARAQTTDEIKTIARRHLATDGANLSLRAVARDLGVVSSAIYRYFASRDDLLTALILDAYNSLGSSVEAADKGVVEAAERAAASGVFEWDALSARWMAMCHAVRDWALAAPHEYALIYGSPVPGYRAPQDTVPAATRAVRVLGGILQDAALRGRFEPDAGQPLPDPVGGNLAEITAALCPAAPPAAMSRAMGAWVQLFGTVSFELFGQLENAVGDKAAFFEHQMRAQADYIGL
jgi:AcrR family transcriptional regulator